MAVVPSAESATDEPCSAATAAAVATIFGPCWLHTPPERVNAHAAPAKALSISPPTMAVFPSPDSAADQPCSAPLPKGPTAPVPTSFGPCWLHTLPERVNTHAAPALVLSRGPPTIAVFPSLDSDTEKPCSAPSGATAPVPTSLACWLHTPPEPVYTHAAPAKTSSYGPPTMPVVPSPDSEPETPR